MELLPGKEAHFLDIFDQAKSDIKAMEGCIELELLRSEDEIHITIWTISLWQSVEALNLYRNSAIFTKTWNAVKPLFSTKAKAWTLTSIEKLP